ncbi:MAG: methyltransferase domain-containing protein [Burkholderiales bacterium]|nr:methyltransferase domain-containing protein [Burkholderiales bacterium]MDE1928385.1 methyltransferase domain-containing protein [Burkholderiales bacterium]MDE2159529.1 methyltransferase domain-containing protein [Burkholderiales bacterium]
MAGPTSDFWQQRFEAGQTPWDRGGASAQLMAWLDAGALAPCRIAVPGCGAGWEVAELARRGFEVVGIDYTPAAVERTRALCAARGVAAEVLQADVLGYAPDRPFDAIYEQTCLCALHPDHWTAYAAQLGRWLRPQGTLWALFMQRPLPAAVEQGVIDGPPYHCDIHAMRALFSGAGWDWPKPPYVKVPHPSRWHELGLPLVRR